MTILKKSVMLLKTQKSPTEKDEYEELLTSNGFIVKQVNTLVFKFHDSTKLRNKLENSDNFSGLLLSSPRCVEAVYLALNKNALDPSWKTKHNYVVGEATHLCALEKLGIECRGKESGNAKKLSEIVVRENIGTNKPFLFPHGNLKTDTLKLELGKSDISIEGVLVYDTLSNPTIEEDFIKMTKNFTELPEYVVFFSPSGVKSSIELFRRTPEYLDKIQFIAIGPVTKTAMEEENLKINAVAASPTAREIVNILLG